MKAYLTLENGSVFEGTLIGAEGETSGEIVFSTTMGSYIEALTDPASYGQILVQSYPLIGNYGMIYSDMESDKIHLKGYVVREICDIPTMPCSFKKLSRVPSQRKFDGTSHISRTT